jgi:hypothetical protein
MSFPASVKDLLTALNDLPPASVTFTSGRNVKDNVHWSGSLFLQSDGGAVFSGQVHESGEVGDNFVLAVSLIGVKDASGKTPVLAHEDTIVGQLEAGFSDKEWHTPGGIPAVVDNWEQIKTTGVHWEMDTSNDPLQTLEIVIDGLFPIDAIIWLISQTGCPKGEHWGNGHWRNANPPYDTIAGNDPGLPPPAVGQQGGLYNYALECVPD